MQTLKFDIHGMHNGGCASNMQIDLAKLDGIDQVKLNFRPGLATVKFDSERATPKAILAMINGHGYLAKIHSVKYTEQDAI